MNTNRKKNENTISTFAILFSAKIVIIFEAPIAGIHIYIFVSTKNLLVFINIRIIYYFSEILSNYNFLQISMHTSMISGLDFFSFTLPRCCLEHRSFHFRREPKINKKNMRTKLSISICFFLFLFFVSLLQLRLI